MNAPEFRHPADGDLKQPWDGFPNNTDVCSVAGCGRSAEDEGWPTLIYVTVLTCSGEEGYAEVTQALCQRHTEIVTTGLVALGFASHNHHGTNLLDAASDVAELKIDGTDIVSAGDGCGGYGRCLTPCEYGRELIQPH